MLNSGLIRKQAVPKQNNYLLQITTRGEVFIPKQSACLRLLLQKMISFQAQIQQKIALLQEAQLKSSGLNR